MIGYSKHTVGLYSTYFDTLQPDSPENILILIMIMENNEYLSTRLHVIHGNYGHEKHVCRKFL